MEVIKKMFVLFFLFFLVGCGQNDDLDKNYNKVSSIEILEAINNNNIIFQTASIKSLKTQELANRYGISTDDLTDGVVYYSTNENISDCIIIAVAKDKSNLEAIERALSSEIIGLSDSFKNNDAESKKIENHLFKTKDLVVILAISDYIEEIENIFDDVTEKKI